MKMQFLALLSILSLIICTSWAFPGPELKTSSLGFHTISSKLASEDVYKLPGNARPLMYDLTLTFKTNGTGYPVDTVDGEVLITLDVDPSETEDKTKSLQINAAINLDSESPPTFVWNEATDDVMNCDIGEPGETYITITCPESIEEEQSVEGRKPIAKLQSFPVGEPQKIFGAKPVTSRFGAHILLELENSVVFLPKRVTETFKPYITELNGGKFAIVFIGEKDVGQPKPLIQFKVIDA